MTSEPRHILRAQQFDRQFLDALFLRADNLKNHHVGTELGGRLMFNMFYEASTRTRMSFSAAAAQLGMKVVGTENAKEFSSNAKGETLEDSIRVLGAYDPDVIVLRHFETGAAQKAADVSHVPIINAGDGAGEHPTQALLDAYTIQSELGSVDGKTVLFGGDLAYGRTGRSLARMLTNYQDTKAIFVAPEQVPMGDDIKQELTQKGVEYTDTQDLEAALPDADVVYWTRLQWERFEDPKLFEQLQGKYTIGTAQLKRMKKDAIVMHPLPRIGEITEEVDADPRAAYFRQAGNGLYVRMALLEWVCALWGD